MLDGLRKDGASLLLTTHHLEEAEARCERIVVMDHGKVIATGTVPELVSQVEASGGRIERVEILRPSLHSVFLHLTGRELRE
jgi:ABC-2 type transport system ATP-binding protein